MTTETLLDKRKKELDKLKRDFKLAAVKYQEVKSNLVCVYVCKCDQILIILSLHNIKLELTLHHDWMDTKHSYITAIPLVRDLCQPLGNLACYWPARTQG